MRHWLRRHWKWAAPAAAVVIGGGAWLVFGFFGFHLIFVDDKVDEAPPLFASGAGTPATDTTLTTEASATPPSFTAGPGASGFPSDAITEERAEAMNQLMAGENPEVTASEEPPMGLTDPELAEMMAAAPAATDAPATTAAPVTTVLAPPSTATPQVRIAASGNFISRSHPTEGSAVVLTDGIQRFLRFEDFETDNGPDLNVYLSTASPDAPAGQFDDDFIDLGDLKGNIGSQNYEIPADVDLDTYSTVVIWCVRFSVIFGAADLAASSAAS